MHATTHHSIMYMYGLDKITQYIRQTTHSRFCIQAEAPITELDMAIQPHFILSLTY
jgi:hypothetical protein